MRAVVLILALLAAPQLPATPASRADLTLHFRAMEGYALVPYRDGSSICVGIGHNLTAHHQLPAKQSYTPAEVLTFFERDLDMALRTCRALIWQFDELPSEVQVITAGVAFTTGRTGFSRFTRFRAALSTRDFSRAARELQASLWATQVSSHRARHSVETLRRHSAPAMRPIHITVSP